MRMREYTDTCTHAYVGLRTYVNFIYLQFLTTLFL
jgi:hypothetical protein